MFPNRQKLNMNGVWLFIPDHENKGEESQWYLNPPIDKGVEISLPLIEPIYEITDSTSLWFIKEFDIENLQDDILLLLHLQNVNFKSVVWLNGQYIGVHEGAFTKFHFNITRYVQKGKNLLVIKVSPFSWQNLSKFTTIYDLSWVQFPGIWGEIYIEFVPRYYIQNIQVKPDIRGKRIVTNVYVNYKDCILRAKIPELNIEIKSKKPKLIIQMEDFETWSPSSPKLYTLQIEYITQTSSDFAIIPFGMRDFSINDNQFILNFKPSFVRAFYFDWNIKDLNTSSYSEDPLREFFSKLRKDNFDLIFSYGRPLPEKIIRICDETGVMVAQTPSIQHDTNSKKWRELAQIEIDELLNNYINNPSFVWMWFEYTSKNFNITNFVHNIRKIDRSRLITIYSPSSKYPSYSCIPYNIHLLPTKQIWTRSYDYLNNTTQKFLEHIGDENTLNFAIHTRTGKIEHQSISNKNKYEGYMSKIKDGFIERDLSLTLTSVENFLEQIKELYITNLQSYVNSILWNPKIKGYCLQNSIDKTIFSSDGFLDFLKLPENLHRQLRQINNNLRLVINLGKTNILQDEETAVNVSFVSHNDEYLSNETETKASLSIQISSPTQQVLWKKKKDVKLKKDNKELWVGDISGSGNIGQHLIVARLSLNNQIISEIKSSINVFPIPQPTNIPVKFIDTSGQFSKICFPWVEEPTTFPPIYIVPPIYNSVFAYNETEFISMMEHVRYGAIAIIFSPPDDWNELSKLLPNCTQFTSVNLEYPDEFLHFHYVKPHPLFLNLPNRCIMKQEYRNILPSKVFLEKGDEDICGCFVIPQGKDVEPFWGSDILVSRYGVGKLVFVYFKVLENIPQDPIALHLFINMVNYFARRAIPSNTDIPLPQNILEQLRFQRSKKLRKWMVIGEFPLIIKEEEDKSYPDVDSMDITSTYWGKYGEIRWKPYYTDINKNHLLDFHEALSIPLTPSHLTQDSGVAFAFAEFTYENKEEIILQIETSNSFTLWFNNNKILENLTSLPQVQIFEAKVSLRKWKNSIFIKMIKDNGEHSFILNFYNNKRKKLDINW